MNNRLEERETYWSKYYTQRRAEERFEVPSQFAAFVAQELPLEALIFDVGCGTARDSLFLARHGFDVVGVDGCPQAVELAQAKAELLGVKGVQFLQADIQSDGLYEELARHDTRQIAVYARFFLHAITDDEQRYFFEHLAAALKSGDYLAIEYRNDRDEKIAKEAAPHFRRYQSADAVNAQLDALGLECVYAIEGQGFAKYKSEDAHVSRSIHQKR